MSMRTPILLALAVALSVATAAAQTKLDVKDIENHPFAADFHAGGKLRMYLQSGDFRIIGGDGDKITVRLSGGNAHRAGDLRVQLEGSNDNANLTVSGGPTNDLEVTIEVPRKTGIFLRMPAGNLELHHIVGDKDVELHAGEMIIDVVDASEYSSVDASVYSGGLEASPFGESHGGLFRSFHKEGNGRYRLHAHVGAGDLTLQ
jgi:hypothetical protein